MATRKSLTDLTIRNAAPRTDGKPRKLADGGGLALWVLPSGRYWRWKYRFHGREKLLALGAYPVVKAAEARRRRDEARRLLDAGKDPGAERKAETLRRRIAGAETFEAVAQEWLALQQKSLATATFEKAKWLLGMVYPYLGRRPVAEISAPELLGALRRIEARGAHETAHRVRQRCGQVFRFAVATGRAERDPAADLRGALAPVVAKHRAAVTDPAAVGALLRALDGYQGQPATCCALKLASLVFVRPGELRAAEWSEIDLDAAEWRIPAARTKMRDEHIVPLARQAVTLLCDELRPLTGRGRYLFPSLRSAHRPMSENTVNAALWRLGYAKDEMCGHGFRALASTRFNELGWATDIIERQLAHAERNKVRAAYNRAQHLAERRRMMQAWADYLDGLRAGGAIVALRQGAA